VAKSGKVDIKIVGEASGLKRAFGQAETAAGGLHGKFGNLTKTIGKLALAFSAVGVAALGGAAAGLFKAGMMAAEEEKAMALLANTIKNVTGATEAQTDAIDKWVVKTMLQTGITDDKLRPAMSNLVVATGSVTKAQDLMGIAMDVSVGRGLDLDAVTKALGKAYNGNVGALGRLGIATKDVNGKTLTYQQILDNLSASYKGSAATAANTYEGKVLRMKEAWGELVKQVGGLVLPVMTKLVDWFLANMPRIQDIVDRVCGAIRTAFDWLSTNVFPVFRTAFQGVVDFFVGQGAAMGGAFSGLIAIVSGVRDIFTAAWPIILSAVKMFVDWLGSADGAALIQTIISGIGTVMSGLQTIFAAVWPAIQGIVQAFVDFLSGPTAQLLITTLISGIGTVLQAMADVFAQVWPVVQSIIKVFIDFWNGASGQALITALLDGVGIVLGALRDVFNAVWPIIKAAVKIFIDWFNSPEGQQTIKTLVDAIGVAMDGVRVVWEAAWPAIKAALQIAKPVLIALCDAITIAVWAIGKAIQAVLDLFKKLDARKSVKYGPNSIPGLGSIPEANSYASGGPIPGVGAVPIVAHGGEYVLTKGDTSLMKQLIATVGSKGGIGSGNTFNFYGVKDMEDGADKFLKRLVTAGVSL
jgi:hypothetical protein